MLDHDRVELVEKVREWLGPEGIEHFRAIVRDHGEVDAVFMDGGFPHAVHFREGMRVRNKLRELTDHAWTAHEYDDRWVGIVEEAIRGE